MCKEVQDISTKRINKKQNKAKQIQNSVLDPEELREEISLE